MMLMASVRCDMTHGCCAFLATAVLDSRWSTNLLPCDRTRRERGVVSS